MILKLILEFKIKLKTKITKIFLNLQKNTQIKYLNNTYINREKIMIIK